MENNENNVQNQEKKQKKGLSTPLVVVMLIAMLIIGIGGGYLLSNNDNLFNKNGAQSNNTNNIENNITEQNKISKKIDENNDLIQKSSVSITLDAQLGINPTKLDTKGPKRLFFINILEIFSFFDLTTSCFFDIISLSLYCVKASTRQILWFRDHRTNRYSAGRSQNEVSYGY